MLNNIKQHFYFIPMFLIRISLPAAIVITFFLLSCKKAALNETITTTTPGTFSSFSVNNISRGNDSATIQWSVAAYSSPNSTVKYKVRLDNGFEQNTDTATTYTFKNLSHDASYNGKIIAYTNTGDTAIASFAIKTYPGILVLGRTDQLLNQNIVEAYDIFTGTLLWRTKVSDYFQTIFPEPIISNDTVFINANQKSPNLLFALSLKTGNLIYSSVAGGSNTLGYPEYHKGKLFYNYVTSLIAINSANGSEVWQKNLSNGLGFTAKPFANSTTVFSATITGVPGLKHRLYALDISSGATKWTYEYDGTFYGTGVLDNDKLYFMTSEGLYCLQQQTGALNWKRMIANDFKTSPQLIIINNRLIFAGPRSYGVYCLDKNNGTTIWNYNNANYLPTIVSTGNGLIYFNEIETAFPYSNNILTALNPQTGTVVWSKPSNYMFSFFINNRIYSRSNFKSDVEVRRADGGEVIFRIANPANYYTDNLARFTVSINDEVFYIPVLN